MSQCYQLLISSLLGNVDLKQELGQVLVDPPGRDCCLPWGGCGWSLWWGAGFYPRSSGASTDQCSPAHLKFIAGTDAFHINLISADAQNLHTLQKVAFGFADSCC